MGKKIYVSSSTVPLFNQEDRINHFASAVLDYCSNSPIEYSEYLKKFYHESRATTLRNWINWTECSGYANQIGRASSKFYASNSADISIVSNELQKIFPPGENETITAYEVDIGYFSEEFWAKHLATQQGLAYLFYSDPSITYELSVSDNRLTCTFSNGQSVSGDIPVNAKSGKRFLEVAYVKTKTIVITPEPDPNTGETPEPTAQVLTSYGYYCYQEYTGNGTLDNEISKGASVTVKWDYLPAVPIRYETAWLGGWDAYHISRALDYLNVTDRDPKNKGSDSYWKFCHKLESSMSSGSMGDVDYITLVLGVRLNSHNQADLKYIYEFFGACHENYSLSIEKKPLNPTPSIKDSLSIIWVNRPTSKGLLSAFKSLIRKLGFQSSYTSFSVRCWKTNLDLEYSWAFSDNFLQSGTFKPGAKVGEYGVLVHYDVYEYVEHVKEWNHDDYREYDRTVEVPYTITLCCHQVSANTWECIELVNLKLVNYIYGGKYAETSAYDAVCNSSYVGSVKHKLGIKVDNAEVKDATFYYVINSGNTDSAFIVPLEQTSLIQIGVKEQLDIAYGCWFLIFNCYVVKKKKWYQSGFLGIVFSFIAIVLAPVGTIVWIAATILFGVFLTVKILEITQKILTIIFGEKVAINIIKWSIAIIKWVLKIVMTIAICIPVIGWIIYGICAGIYFTITAAEILWLGGSLEDALKTAAVETLISAGSALAGGYAGVASSTAVNISVNAAVGFASGFTSNLVLQKGNFKSALKAGVISGVTSAIGSAIGPKTSSNTLNFVSSTGSTGSSINVSEITGNLLKYSFVSVATNPNTYANLLNMTLEERMYHRLANLENDYQEFSDKYTAAQRVLEILQTQTCSVVTAQYVALMQSLIGKSMEISPDSLGSLTPDNFLATALATATEQAKVVLGSIEGFAERKLTLDGYEPSSLHYTICSYTNTWDAI